MKLFFALICLLAVLGAYADRLQMEREVTKFDSDLWMQEGPARETDLVHAVFVLKKCPMAVKKFESLLLDISTPSSANYGKWLSKDQVREMLAPEEESLFNVMGYLANEGVMRDNIKISELKDRVFVTLPASAAARMFDTEFARFRSTVNEQISLLRVTKPYSLPGHVANVVSYVDDIVRLPSIRQDLRFDAPDEVTGVGYGKDDAFGSCGQKCKGYTTPEVLEEAYSFSKLTTAAEGNSVAVAEFQYQYYDDTDLKDFSSACGVTTEVDNAVGGNTPMFCKLGCTESLLDIEYIGAITNPIPLTVIYSGTYSLSDWIEGIMKMDSPPLVHSVSYGNDEVQQTSTEYMQEVNTQFMAAGAMGLSILFAAGDQGVWGRSGSKDNVFHPDFPASSPYVTAVGGTNFAEKSTIGKETAWSCGGGGFSNTFTTPDWQKTVVSDYLTKTKSSLPASSYYNATGRAYPDVAALGGQTNPYCIAVRSGSFGGVAGTSASSPVVAGIFAQLNNVRLAAGKSALGFLNPFIYANGACFNDISDGSTNSCNKREGFPTAEGWDPATGFGSPNYECLAKLM